MPTSFDDFKKEFSSSLNNRDVKAVSKWKQPNGGRKHEPEEYLKNTISQINSISDKLHVVATRLVNKTNEGN